VTVVRGRSRARGVPGAGGAGKRPVDSAVDQYGERARGVPGAGDAVRHSSPEAGRQSVRRYEDADGNGAASLPDVTFPFDSRKPAYVADHPQTFDSNDDGRFTLADVTRLFLGTTT
jgi:hypothetical protein